MTDTAGAGGAADRRNGESTDRSAGSFGPNAWLVEDMYDRFLSDPSSVGASWREVFADDEPAPVPVPAGTGPVAPRGSPDHAGAPGSPPPPAASAVSTTVRADAS